MKHEPESMTEYQFELALVKAVFSIIDFGQPKEYGISNLKLQKILYFIQAYFLICEPSRCCFRAKIEAWNFGPVVPIAYNEYTMFGGCDIPTVRSYIVWDKHNIWNSKRIRFEDVVIADEDKVLIDKVVDKFAKYTATDLVALTQRQTPWMDAYMNNQISEITPESLKNYFSN